MLFNSYVFVCHGCLKIRGVILKVKTNQPAMHSSPSTSTSLTLHPYPATCKPLCLTLRGYGPLKCGSFMIPAKSEVRSVYPFVQYKKCLTRCHLQVNN